MDPPTHMWTRLCTSGSPAGSVQPSKALRKLPVVLTVGRVAPGATAAIVTGVPIGVTPPNRVPVRLAPLAVVTYTLKPVADGRAGGDVTRMALLVFAGAQPAPRQTTDSADGLVSPRALTYVAATRQRPGGRLPPD